jgi:surfeit locus 1 family protein
MRLLRLDRITFAPSLWSSALALVFIFTTLALGEWQSGRAREKQELQLQWEARSRESPVRLASSRQNDADVTFKNVELRGEFVPERTLYVDNRVHRKQAGYHVVSLFRLEGGGEYFLVNRGWLPAPGSRSQSPAAPGIAGPLVLRGIVSKPARGIYELAPESAKGSVRQHLVIDRFQAEFGVQLPPLVVLQTSESPDGLVRDWPQPDAGVNTHLGYAFQWRALAVAALIAWMYFGIRKKHDDQ